MNRPSFNDMHDLTNSRSATRMKPKSTFPFRLILLLVAILLACESVWLLLPGLSEPGIERLPLDQASAVAAAKKRDVAVFAASIGSIRGDLWAQSAYTYADLLWSGPGLTVSTQALEQARGSLDRALDEAPHRSDVWLLLAALSQRFRWEGIDPIQALKMAYYTGPSERGIIPLRIFVAAKSDFIADVEMRQFVSRDLRWLAADKEKSAIAAAYSAASAAGKHFIEQTLTEISPPALQWLRSDTQPSQLPD